MFCNVKCLECNFIFSVILLSVCNFCDSLKRDDPCTFKNNSVGTCLNLNNCQDAIDQIDNGISPTFCNPGAEINFNALVCCNAVERKQQLLSLTRVSHEKCKEYYPKLFVKDKFVFFAAVSGQKALAREYTHMALVGYGEKEAISWLCGGSLVSEKFVLTAAHCIESQLGSPQWVRLGELDTATDEDDAAPEEFTIIHTIVHPRYNPPVVYHDIGLLELDRSVRFNDFIKPACLPQTTNTSKIQYAYATGWGHTAYGGTSSSHLIEVFLKMENNNTRCNRFYRSFPKSKTPNGIMEDTQICAGGNEGRDTCQGDSGGPLQVQKAESRVGNKAYEIIGITSFGLACGLKDTPGIYTRVAYYLDWIERNVWSSETADK